jgi:hypothetical protein
LGDGQERHRGPEQDQADPLRPLAHFFPPFCFCLDTFRVLLSFPDVIAARAPFLDSLLSRGSAGGRFCGFAGCTVELVRDFGFLPAVRWSWS